MGKALKQPKLKLLAPNEERYLASFLPLRHRPSFDDGMDKRLTAFIEQPKKIDRKKSNHTPTSFFSRQEFPLFTSPNSLASFLLPVDKWNLPLTANTTKLDVAQNHFTLQF